MTSTTERRRTTHLGIARRPMVDAVLCDRDGTLIADVPYNGDPARVVPLPGVHRALDDLRNRGVRLAIVSNQSGVARGLITDADVAAVNARVAEVLGPFDAVVWCPHGAADGCGCRKPRPGMLHEAARRLGTPIDRCGVIGDTAADVDAALAAGARPMLVPNARTRRSEVQRATHMCAATFAEAAERLVNGT